MKKNHNVSYLVIIMTVFIGVLACQKIVVPIQNPDQPKPDSVQTHQDSTPVHHDTIPVKHDSVKPKVDTPAAPVPFPVTSPTSSCPVLPIYGDSIIYTQPTSGSDFIVHPVNSPGAGHYFSWPIGMIMDSLTGAINVTKSETGMRYAIGFVKSGTTDTCLSTLIIGGAAYMDSVYVLLDGHDKALPYYNANPYLPPACSGPGTSCTFDVTGSAAAKKVIVNQSSGEIDLKKTLEGSGGILGLGGAFGLLPLDGQTITVPIYYKLNDASNHALEHIDVQIAYYSSKSTIGVGLLGSVVNKLTSVLNLQLISKSYNPRPPLIIIVRRN